MYYSWDEMIRELRKYNRVEVISYIQSMMYDVVDPRDLNPRMKWDSLEFQMSKLQRAFVEGVDSKLSLSKSYPIAPLHVLSYSRLQLAEWAVAEIIREHREKETQTQKAI